MEKSLLHCILVVLTVSCSSPSSEQGLFSKGERVAELNSKKLEELSGLAASKTNPGYLWSVNDSGNDPEVFLIDRQLKIAITCRLKGVDNRDWEDVTVGPGPVEGKSYVYVGEIGDNNAVYKTKYIYRFEEPKIDGSSGKITIDDFDTIAVQLTDGIKDTETLMINPVTKNLYIVSKREDPVHVYEIPYPYSTTETITVSSIATLPLGLAVAGNFSEDGKEILIKNYKKIYYWNNAALKPLAELFKEQPVELPYAEEPQGESICWSSDGKGFFTISEKKPGERSFLMYHKRN